MSEKIIFFDGVCPLCNRFIRIVQRLDSNKVFRFSSLQSRTAEQKLKGLLPESSDSVVLWDGKELFTHSTAVCRIFFYLGGWWTFFSYFLAAWPIGIRDKAYHFVAKNRYRWFGKLDSCPIPTPEERSAYLD